MNEDIDMGEALKDSNSEELERVCCDSANKELLVELLLRKGVIQNF